MPLQKQTLQIPFNAGLDTKIDPKLLLPGKLNRLENGVFTSGGRIKKRNGYTALAQTVENNTALSTGDALDTFKNELLLFGNSRFYSYAENAGTWFDKGAFVSLGASKEAIIRNQASQTIPDMAQVNGTAVYAWADSRGGIRASIIDLDSGLRLINDVEITATGTLPRCVAINQSLFVIFVDGTTLKGKKWNHENRTAFRAEFTIASNVAASNKYHDIVPKGQDAILAYHNNASGITVTYLQENEVVGSPPWSLPYGVTVAEDVSTCLSVYVNTAATAVYVAYHNTTDGLRVFSRLTSDLSASLAATTVDSSTSPVINGVSMIENAAGNIVFVYEINAASTYNHLLKTNTLTLPSTMGTAAVLTRSVGLASRMFKYNSILYFVAAYQSTLQNSYFIINTSGNIIAKFVPQVGGGLAASNLLFNIINPETGIYAFALVEKTKLNASGDDVFSVTGISKAQINFTDRNAYNSEEIGNNLHFGGGILSMYDGASIVEHGFHLYPENITSVDATSGGSMADGTYNYKVVFEWIDNQGQVHFSAPSVAISDSISGGGGSGKITLTIPTLRLTAKTVTCGVYRTAASGAIYYKVGTVANSTTADTATYEDTAVDSSITDNELLYTTGNVVDHIAPPCVTVLTSYKGRLFAVDAEDRLTVHYTKTISKIEPVAFFDGFAFTLEPFGGGITNLAKLDEKLIIFKESRIYYITGEGPTNTGTQNDFSEPQLITTDTGCSQVDSIVLMPQGLMFKSNKGLYLLTRELAVEYIGGNVDLYNSSTISSAVLVENTNEVRFTTTDNKGLVYDYRVGQWSTFTNLDSNDAVLWNNTYHLLKSSGKVLQEASGVYKDENAPVKLLIETAWIKLNDIQGFGRIWRAIVLGDYFTQHVLKVSVGFDYQDFYNETHDYDYNSADGLEALGVDTPLGDGTFGGTSDGVFQFRMHLSQQKCEAIRFKFEDVVNLIIDQSYALSSLQLEVGLKQGVKKLSAARTVTAT